jgi:hypothetical protein
VEEAVGVEKAGVEEAVVGVREAATGIGEASETERRLRRAPEAGERELIRGGNDDTSGDPCGSDVWGASSGEASPAW